VERAQEARRLLTAFPDRSKAEGTEDEQFATYRAVRDPVAHRRRTRAAVGGSGAQFDYADKGPSAWHNTITGGKIKPRPPHLVDDNVTGRVD
jgi:hypothetical protein